MRESASTTIVWDTPVGRILIRSFCSSDEIRMCSFDSQFGIHPHYKSLYTRKETLENIAEMPDANVVLALIDYQHIIGFGVLVHPDPEERWAELGPDTMIEIKAIEVCRDWRSTGVASGIVQQLLNHPRIENMIAYMVGYSWTWDLDGALKTAQEYRTMLIRLFGGVGFQEYQTNEPNICLKSENIFMARIGNSISKDVQTQFKWLRFGVPPSG
jgi:acetoin utilization protein AcuA